MNTEPMALTGYVELCMIYPLEISRLFIARVISVLAVCFIAPRTLHSLGQVEMLRIDTSGGGVNFGALFH